MPSISIGNTREQETTLFQVISRVGEYSRVESASDSIPTQDDYSMLPSFKEFIIKKYLPLLVC